MRRDDARWALPLTILLAFAGAGIGLVLTSFHLSRGAGLGKIVELACSGTDGRCAEVLASRWAALPGDVPLAALGVLYFGGLGVWYLVVGTADRRGRHWQGLPLAAQIAGCLASLFLLEVMLVSLHAVCWWCILSHLLNFALLSLAWKLWPREGPSEGPPRPSPRLAAAGILLVCALAAVTLEGIGLVRSQSVAEGASRYADSLRQDVDLQRYLHLRQPSRPIALRRDDPLRGNPKAPHVVVVFSDFECPACRKFASFCEHELLPRLGERLKIVYRNFPLDPKCNPWQDQAFHHQACEAAFAAEAARQSGGAPAFWRMHDLLFANQSRLAEAPWAELGRQAGLDGAALAGQVARQTGRERVREDAAAGKAVQLEFTPTVFLDGRPVSEWNRLDLWQALLAEPARGGPPSPGAG